MANTMFEVIVSNSPRNQIQNVAGLYGTGTGGGFTTAACPAGTLCVRNGLVPSEGYEDFDILNGDTWYFNATTANVIPAGMTGDHTGIFACNTYDVNKVGSGNLIYNLGANTLGLETPAGVRADFTELIVGEQYAWSAGNFSAAVSTNQYFTVGANGQWVPTASVPTASGVVYGQLMRTKPMNEGSTYWGDGYVLMICRAAVSASE